MVISTSLLLQQIVWRKIFIRSVAFWQKAVASFCFHANCTGDIHGCWKGNARYCASNRCIPFVFKDKCIPEEYSIDPLVVLNYDLATEWNICIWRIQFWHFVNYHAHFFPFEFWKKVFFHFFTFRNRYLANMTLISYSFHRYTREKLLKRVATNNRYWSIVFCDDQCVTNIHINRGSWIVVVSDVSINKQRCYSDDGMTYIRLDKLPRFFLVFPSTKKYLFLRTKGMSENSVADIIASAVIAVAGGALSAYLAKKMIDALDVSKKVVLLPILNE